MKAETKLALRRFILRWLRKLFDMLEDRLHAAEVTLRNDLSDRDQVRELAASSAPKADQSQDMPHRAPARPETFLEWEARRSGIAPVKKSGYSRHRRLSAAAFDLRFSR